MRRLHVVRRGMGIRGVVVVGIKLNPGDVLLERVTGTDPETFAPAPDQIQAFAQDRGEGIDILVPCAIEVAEEQQVVVFEVFLRLPLPRKGNPLRGKTTHRANSIRIGRSGLSAVA